MTTSIDLTRVFEVAESDGGTSRVTLHLAWAGVSENADVSVLVTIADDSGAREVLTIHGVDGLQALLNALGVARAILESRPAWRAGGLTWLGMRDLGLSTEQRLDGA